MARRKWIQINGDLVEVDPYTYQPPNRMNTDSALYGDRHYDGMRATDGTDISTRSKHREYMKLNNVTTVDDFKDTWARAREQRERLYTQGGTFSRRDVERAISQLQNR